MSHIPINTEKKGYLIYSPYNPNIVVFDGTNLPYNECSKVENLLRSFHEEKNKVDNILLEERANYSRMLNFNLKKIKSQCKKLLFYRRWNRNLLNLVQSTQEDHRQLQNQAAQERILMEDTIIQCQNEISDLEDMIFDLEEQNDALKESTGVERDLQIEDIHDCIIS